MLLNLFQVILCGGLQQVHNLTNEYRKSKGLPPYVREATLDKAAALQVDHIMNIEDLSHEGNPPNERVLDRAINAGFDPQSVGENLAEMNDPSPELPVNGWKNSPSHDRNLLADYKMDGYAMKKGKNGLYYWAAVYGTSRSIEPNRDKEENQSESNVEEEANKDMEQSGEEMEQVESEREEHSEEEMPESEDGSFGDEGGSPSGGSGNEGGGPSGGSSGGSPGGGFGGEGGSPSGGSGGEGGSPSGGSGGGNMESNDQMPTQGPQLTEEQIKRLIQLVKDLANRIRNLASIDDEKVKNDAEEAKEIAEDIEAEGMAE